MKLTNKVAIVTGGPQGIGEAIARRYAAEGAHVAVVYSRNDNLKGVFFCSKAVIPYFRKRGGGKIINISSIAGVGAFPNCAAYCASKGGLVNLTKAFAAELAHEHINVNSLAPGNVATPLNAHLRGPGHEDYERRMSERTPTRRSFMDAQDMAGAAVFLASDDSKGVHGAILMVDDGWAA